MIENPCPVCERGEVVNGHCARCNVYIPGGTVTSYWPEVSRRKPRRRPDQGQLGPIADYVNTKEDKR